MGVLTKAMDGTHENATLSPAGMARHLAGATMQALVYHGPGKRAWEQKPRPEIREAIRARIERGSTASSSLAADVLMKTL